MAERFLDREGERDRRRRYRGEGYYGDYGFREGRDREPEYARRD